MDDNNKLYPVHRGRSPSRNTAVRAESPMTRSKLKQLEAEKKQNFDDTVFLKEDAFDDVSEKFDETIKGRGVNRMFFNDDPKHLYGLDIDTMQIPSKPITNNSYLRNRENRNGNVIPVEKKSHKTSGHQTDASGTWPWFSNFSGILKFMSALCLVCGVIIWIGIRPNNANYQVKMESKEQMDYIYLSKMESILSQMRKQQQTIKAFEFKLKKLENKCSCDKKINTSRINELEKQLSLLQNDVLFTNEIVLVVKKELKEVCVDNLQHELSSVKNDVLLMRDTIYMVRKELKEELVDNLLQQLSSLKSDILLINKTVDTVRTELKEEITKEKETFTDDGKSLCIGEECKFKTHNTIALIQSALEINRADTLGLPDFALNTGGGSIHHKHHSETCDVGAPIIQLFGLPLYRDPRSPRAAISSGNLPGDCWPMKGSEGYLVVELATAIQPTMVTLEHLDKKLDRYTKYRYTMAPKDCEVYAWLDESGTSRLKLGSFTYGRRQSAIQTFRLQKLAPRPVSYVELRILNNYGNADCTCIYRFRIHGESYAWANYDGNNDFS